MQLHCFTLEATKFEKKHVVKKCFNQNLAASINVGDMICEFIPSYNMFEIIANNSQKMNKCPHKRNHFNPENVANHWFFLRRAVSFLGGKCNLSGFPFPWDPQTSDLAKRCFFLARNCGEVLECDRKVLYMFYGGEFDNGDDIDES